jgi:hypothetical protein
LENIKKGFRINSMKMGNGENGEEIWKEENGDLFLNWQNEESAE